jgi:hypothetical protein
LWPLQQGATSPVSSSDVFWAWSALRIRVLWELGVGRMLRVFRMLRMLGMFWVFRVLGMLRAVRILGWPLLAAPGQPGRAAKRVLLEFHAEMVAVRLPSA